MYVRRDRLELTSEGTSMECLKETSGLRRLVIVHNKNSIMVVLVESPSQGAVSKVALADCCSRVVSPDKMNC